MPITSRRRSGWMLRLAIAFLALTGQSAIVAISASGDEIGAAAHVERSGVSLHHAHNEATCVVCRVMSLHGRAEVIQTPAAAIALGSDAKPSVPARRPQQAILPGNFSRAPPGNA